MKRYVARFMLQGIKKKKKQKTSTKSSCDHQAILGMYNNSTFSSNDVAVWTCALHVTTT